MKAFGKVVVGHTDAQAREWTSKGGPVLRDWDTGGSGVQGIAAGECGHHSCGIANRMCKRADAVKRRGECNQAVARNSSVTWHHRGNAAKRARLTNRAAGISAKSDDGQVCGDSRARAAA